MLAFEQKKEQTREDGSKRHLYIVTDDPFTTLTADNQFSGDVQTGQSARFDDPSSALQAALEAKQAHADRLEGNELYVYRVNPTGDLQKDPVIVTDIPLKMRTMWGKILVVNFPKTY